MAKRLRKNARRNRQVERQTNWLVIGGVIVGVILIFGLLFLALREPEQMTLSEFCLANSENCLSEGDVNAPVTVVEVSDYSCNHCRDFNLDSADQLRNAYVDSGQVRWIVLPYALRAETVASAESAYCAQEQDGFSAYHRQMFEIQALPGALTPAGFLESAGRANLDLETFNACLDADSYGPMVQENLEAARLAGVNSTPTFFINDVEVSGNRPDAIIEQIEAQLSS